MKLIFIVLIMNSSIQLNASEVCNNLGVYEYYQKLKKNGPLQNEFENKIKVPKAEIELAKQRPNPSLDFDYLRGDEFGLTRNTYTLSAMHTIELGNKRNKRVNKAIIDSELETRSLDLGLYKEYVEQIKKYQKLGQLKILNETLKEAINTFGKLSEKLQSRKGLNPEERISLSTLKLATNEYKSQLNDTQNEYEILKGEISFFSQCSVEDLNYKPLKFSEMNDSSMQISKGVIDLENLKIKSAEADLEVEKSLGYSNLSIGPQVEYQQAGDDELYSAGVVVSFALPLFHTNNGGKQKASSKLNLQRINSQNRINFLEVRKKNLKSKYSRSLEVLTKMPSLIEAEKKHQEIERLFARGIVSMALTIEAHRQNLDYITSRFETEMDLLDVLEEMILLTGNKEMINKHLFTMRSK